MRRLAMLVAAAGCLVAACSAAPESTGAAVVPSPATSSAPALSPSVPPSTVPERAAPLVVLDPGHNGGNARHPGEINRPVPAGRGRTKACNTTGTSTDAGYAEHAFTFDVARRVGELLTARGVRVAYTRTDDEGVGPCVDERARIGNAAGADAVVSIHADGSRAAGAHGFHVAYSAPPLNDAQGEPALRLARAVRDGMRDAGLAVAGYLGERGLAARDDLAGLNLSTRPAVLVECGNMRDPAEAAAMSSAAGRQRYAEAITTGIAAYLDR